MSIPEPKWITSEALQLIHAQQLERYGGTTGIIDVNVVESVLERPLNLHAYGGDEVDLARLAAACLCGLAQKEGLVDGNKRTGLAAMLIFLSINEQPLHAPPAELYRVVMDVAQNRIGEEEIATWLRRQL